MNSVFSKKSEAKIIELIMENIRDEIKAKFRIDHIEKKKISYRNENANIDPSTELWRYER